MRMNTDVQQFLARLGASLIHYGSPAQRVELFLQAIAGDLGIRGTFSATPTLLMMDLRRGEEQTLAIERVHGFSIDLDRLTALDRLANEVAVGERSPAEALGQLDKVLSAPPRFGPWLTWLCFVLASGAATRFFGGGWMEMALGALGGAVLGIISAVATSRQLNPRLIETLGSFSVALSIALVAPLLGPVDVNAAVFGGIIVLVPGFTIAIGVSELVTHHVTAGVSRLGAAAVSTMMLGFGVVFGLRLGEQIVGQVPPSLPIATAPWVIWLLVPVAVISIAVLFLTPIRQWGWVLLVSSVGFVTLEVSQDWVRPELAVFLGALALGCGSNLHARLKQLPSGITRLPGLLFLVPGSLGFLSVTRLMAGDALEAVAAAGQVAIVATALVTGLIVAGSALPPRKVL